MKPAREFFSLTAPDFECSSRLEWLETTGTGAFASSTICGLHTRRYHGLLVGGAGSPSDERRVLLSRLDESIRIGSSAVPLATRRFRDAVHPRGHLHLTAFHRGLFPEFRFDVELDGRPFRLTKTIAACSGKEAIVIRYDLQGEQAVTLDLEPFFSGRNYHSLTRKSGDTPSWEFRESLLTIEGDGLPPVTIRGDALSFEARPEWHFDFWYPLERELGYDDVEDLFLPGILTARLVPGEPLMFLIHAESNLDESASMLLRDERERREALLAQVPASAPLQRLALAADQFLVRSKDGTRTIVAGYPWFTPWGRDTMISLPGLCLATKRFEDAAAILRTWAAYLERGLLPNRLESGSDPVIEYNTVDATLWFCVVVWRYLECTGDAEFARATAIPAMTEIIRHHDRGTCFDIRVDQDDLISAGNPATQLTWMDARYEGKAITPRAGKPVEVNALWVNTLVAFAEIHARWGREPEAVRFRERAEAAAREFNRLYWSEELGNLFDCIEPDGTPDSSLRPNQLFALSLPYPLVSQGHAVRILSAVRKHLLTPYGLRTLDPSDPRYHGEYKGALEARDSAYHQGTAWPWLTGPYVTGLIRYGGEAGQQEAAEVLDSALKGLNQMAVGTICELRDGDPPHRPKGAPAQAWSVAELLRTLLLDGGEASLSTPR